MRLLSVRIPENEFLKLKDVCHQHGLGNVSGFVRSSLTWVIANGQRTLLDILRSGESPMGSRQFSGHSELDEQLDNLRREVQQLKLWLQQEGFGPAGSSSVGPKGPENKV